MIEDTMLHKALQFQTLARADVYFTPAQFWHFTPKFISRSHSK